MSFLQKTNDSFLHYFQARLHKLFPEIKRLRTWGSSLPAHTLRGLAGARKWGKRSFQTSDFIHTATGDPKHTATEWTLFYKPNTNSMIKKCKHKHQLSYVYRTDTFRGLTLLLQSYLPDVQTTAEREVFWALFRVTHRQPEPQPGWPPTQNSSGSSCLLYFYLFVCLFIYLFIYLERMTNINVWLPFTCPLLGTWPTTRAHALTGNRTGDTFGLQSVLNPLACTSQGSSSPLNRLGDKTMSETQNSTQSPQNHLGFMWMRMNYI